MTKHTPSYYRLRLKAFEQWQKKPVSEDDVAIIRNGVVPPGYDLEATISQLQKETTVSNEPLTFTELTRYNNWFAIHPEKVAGQEVITTSREFPITIKGGEKEIKEMFGFLDGKPAKEEATDSDFNVMVYGKYKTGKYQAMDMANGQQASNLMYASLITASELPNLTTSLEKAIKENPDWTFQIRVAGKSKVLKTFEHKKDNSNELELQLEAEALALELELMNMDN